MIDDELGLGYPDKQDEDYSVLSSKQSSFEHGGTSTCTTDTSSVYQKIWELLARARAAVDSNGREPDCTHTSEDCQHHSTIVLLSAFPLCAQLNSKAMVSSSPLESPESDAMFVVVKEDSAAGRGKKAITVNNVDSPWTFNPNSMDSGKTLKLNTVYKGTEEMQLRVRQSSLKLKKKRKTPETGEPGRPEQVIWMFNRSMQLGSDDYKVEDDIWVGMVKNKQSGKTDPELITIDNPRKR